MKNNSLAILQILAFITMIVMNSLANILPINGMNTGELSALYPNLFVPAGFTFGIWGVIYSFLLAYLIFSSIQLFKPSSESKITAYSIIATLATINFFLNAAWILAWHYQQLIISVIIMLGLLLSLTLIYIKNAAISKHTSFKKSLLIHIPFVIYLAWICVATVANVTAVLVYYKWSGWGIEASNWSVNMIFVAFVLATYFGLYKKQWAFCFVIAWAFFGIHKGQQSSDVVVSNTAKWLSVTVIAFGTIALGISLKKLAENKKPI